MLKKKTQDAWAALRWLQGYGKGTARIRLADGRQVRHHVGAHGEREAFLREIARKKPDADVLLALSSVKAPIGSSLMCLDAVRLKDGGTIEILVRRESGRPSDHVRLAMAENILKQISAQHPLWSASQIIHAAPEHLAQHGIRYSRRTLYGLINKP